MFLYRIVATVLVVVIHCLVIVALHRWDLTSPLLDRHPTEQEVVVQLISSASDQQKITPPPQRRVVEKKILPVAKAPLPQVASVMDSSTHHTAPEVNVPSSSSSNTETSTANTNEKSGQNEPVVEEYQQPNFSAAYLKNPKPPYPVTARRLQESGTVLLRVYVDIHGGVAQIELRSSSGSPRLDEAAADAVRKWRFIPARLGNETMAAWVLVPITFRLDS